LQARFARSECVALPAQIFASFTQHAPCPYTSTLTMNFFLALARLKIRREGQ